VKNKRHSFAKTLGNKLLTWLSLLITTSTMSMTTSTMPTTTHMLWKLLLTVISRWRRRTLWTRNGLHEKTPWLGEDLERAAGNIAQAIARRNKEHSKGY
jgi:hypothetical protein